MTLIDGQDLTSSQLLALIAVNLAPLTLRSDGHWRSAWRDFPDAGITEADMLVLAAEGLIDRTPRGAVITVRGRELLERHQQVNAGPSATPALGEGGAVRPSLH
jgi:hypothetical protein